MSGRRARDLCLTAGVVWALFGLSYLMIGRPNTAALDGGLAASMLLLGVGVHTARVNVRVAAWGAVLLNLGGLVLASLWSGQSASMSGWFLCCVPLIAAWVLSPRELVIATALSVAGTMVVWGSELVIPLEPEFVASGPELLFGQLALVAVVAFASSLAWSGARDEVAHLQEEQQVLSRARDAAQGVAQERGRFAAMLAHEVRNPLNAMLGPAQLLLDASDERQAELARTIVASGRGLLATLDEMLQLSRIESEGLTIRSVPFDLDLRLEETVRLFGVTAWDRGLDLAWDHGALVPRRVVADPTLLSMVLTNLLSNAIKFTDQGHVVLRVRLVDKHSLRFEVEDTGVGLTPAEVSRLFVAYAQANDEVHASYGGTGLGLALVKRVVEGLGGATGVDSVAGEGSTFWFTMKIEAVADLEDPETTWAREHGTVLLIEPNPATAAVVESRCRRWGFDVLRPTAEAQTRELWASQDWDLALVCGECVRDMGLLRVIAGRPVVWMTSDPRDRSPEHPDVVAQLNKPVRPRLLRAVLRDVSQGGHSDETTAPPAPPRDLAGSHPLRVLVVDDDRTNRSIAQAMLERLGYQAALASGGLNALQQLEQASFDVVFVDLVMPEMTGEELTATLVGRPDAPTIVICTANLRPKQEELLRSQGVEHFLTKPLMFAELVETLHAVRRPTSAAAPSLPPVLVALSETLGEESVAVLVKVFLGSLLEQEGILTDAIAAHDFAAIRSSCHRLRGSAGTLGQDVLGDAAGKAELAAEEDVVACAREVLAQIRRSRARLEGLAANKPG